MASTTSTYAAHPCFGTTACRKAGRVHLPVAPRANVRIRFSENVSHAPAMSPEEALAWLGQVLDAGTEVDIVGITGPGDPLAAPEPTLRTLRLVREKYPHIPLCLTTSGIGADLLAEELAEIGLSHVTLLVDAVIPEVAEKLYAWIRPSTKTLPLAEAAKVLMNEQAKAITAFKRVGLTVKINTTVYPEYNAGHVEEIAIAMAALGADIMAVVPFVSTDENGKPFSNFHTELFSSVRDGAARHMDLMSAWDGCGADIVGLEKPEDNAAPVAILPKPSQTRPNVAVVSDSGMDIDLHLGHASRLLIYGPREDGLACLLEARDAPKSGNGSGRWEQLADIVKDCFVLLTANAGDSPKQILSKRGVSVLITDGEIAGTVDMLYGGGKKKNKNPQMRCD